MTLVLVQRLRRTPGLVQCAHQGRSGALSQRVFRHERLEHGHDVGGPATGQHRLSPALDGRPATLLQPDRLELGDVGLREAGVRLPPP